MKSTFYCCRWLCVLGFLLVFSETSLAQQQGAPDILLAQIYRDNVDPSLFLVSEKLDGVRAIWNGKVLLTRAGNTIAAPAWFTEKLPKTPLDGELWMGRGQFDATSGAVRKAAPLDTEWRKISYMVFELPNALGTFEVRAKRMAEIVEKAKLPHLKAVPQIRVKNQAALQQKLKEVVAAGGEGLMLHRADAPYITGRSDVLLKLKLLLDAEAKVIAHLAGRGKFKGKMGAMLVETPEGMRFKLGTGFSDAQRANPPAIGSTITYTYRDVTKTGKPKFASFLRVRDER